MDNYSKTLERQQWRVIKSIDSEAKLSGFKYQLHELLNV